MPEWQFIHSAEVEHFVNVEIATCEVPVYAKMRQERSAVAWAQSGRIQNVHGIIHTTGPSEIAENTQAVADSSFVVGLERIVVAIA